MLTLLIVGMLLLSFDVKPVEAETGTIYIRPDGSVDPPTAPIQRDGDIYTFTDNINETIKVQRDNVVINGNGHAFQGTGWNGISLESRSKVTIKNTNIIGFDYGIWIFHSMDNTISGNNITDNFIGIFLTLFSPRNTIRGNNITSNGYGISGHDSIDNIIYHNNFIDNGDHVQDTFEGPNIWDNGSEGNYWSDYESNDSEGDGLGDTPYVIDENNRDSYPLMSPWAPSPVEEREKEVPLWTKLWFYGIVAVGIVTLAGAVHFLKKRKPPTPAAPQARAIRNFPPITIFFLFDVRIVLICCLGSSSD